MKLLKACLIALTVLPLTAAAQSQTKLTVDDFTINANETQTLTVNLENPDMTVTLVQFDLELPEGLSIPKDEDDEYLIDMTSRASKKHTLDYNDKNGRVLLSSSSNKTLSGTSGAIITIDITAAATFETGTITLKNIEIVSPDNTAANPVFSKPDNVVINIETSGISGVTMSNEYQGSIYTLQGVKVGENASSFDSLEKGIYILNGKKIVKK
jgi:hypothetical protein